jgi:PAS domain S-box-containing protein
LADTASASKAASLRRDAVLEAVAFAAERLLRSTDWRAVADEVLARLGVAADVSRASVMENELDAAGGLFVSVVAEWSTPGVDPQLGADLLDRFSWEPDFARWVSEMRSGRAVVGSVESFPESERPALRTQDIVSLAYFPIEIDGWWWGCVGFDDCAGERDWSTSDLDGLRTAAALIAAAISRQKQEQQIRGAERRSRSVVENIPAVTYVDVVDGGRARMAFVSPQIETLLGHPSERYLDDPDFWFELVHPDDRRRVEEAGARTSATGGVFDEEYRMRTEAGAYVWVHDTSTRVAGEDGRPSHFQGFMIDITARKAAEERLRETERRYRSMVESIPAVTYTDQPMQDGPTRMTFVSPQVERVLGLPPQRFLDDPLLWFELMHPEDLTRLRAANAFDTADITPFDEEYRMLRADGCWVWVHDTSTAVFGEDGEIAYFQGFMIDISLRKEAEQRLRETEERFRTIVEHTPVITYQELPSGDGDDPNSMVAYVSPQIEQILGYSADRWAARPGHWAEVIHPDDLPEVLEESSRTARSGEPYSQDYRMFASDGRIVWFHDESHLVRDDDGEPLLWQGVMVDITERKEAEEQLRRAQDQLQALVEHIPAVVYIETQDADPHKFYLSPQVEQIFGYSTDEWRWTADFWLDHLHPEDRPGVEALDRDARPAQGTFSVDYRFLRADGSYAWVHDQAVFLQTADGEGFWQGFLFDITERKQAEEQLLATERVFRATVEHLPAVVYRESPAETVEDFYISPQVERVFGYASEEWTYDSFWEDRIHPEDRPAVMEVAAHASRTKEPYVVDYRFLRKDGTYVWVHDEATFEVERGQAAFWQGFMLDITERKHAEQYLREAEEKFRTIVEQNPAVIYTQEFEPGTAVASRTTYISPRQDLLFGYTADEILADPTLWTRAIHPDDRERVIQADVTSNDGDTESFSLEYRLIARDGRIVWVQDQARLVKVEGRPPFWQGFLLDVTERKQAEEQLARALDVEREATRRLRALDEMKNTFLQAVSHDLRTPLAAILGLAITLERGDVQLEEDDARDLARRIADNARRLDRLVTNLLDLDRLARGIVTPKLQPTDVGSLVRRVVAESELIADARLRTDIRSIVVPIDAAKIERIVENLLANMARHTPETATVWVTVRAVEDGVLILVEDDGPGIASELRETVFEPFQQGPDAPQHAPGVGVGLTLVRRFAELHGGRAWVEERAGGGASFHVMLPADPVQPLVPLSPATAQSLLG